MSVHPIRRRRHVAVSTRRRRFVAFVTVLLAAAMSATIGAEPASAASYVAITGAGSTWSQNAINAWTGNVQQFGMVVHYSGVGSTTGRTEFKQDSVDWAASDIPYGVQDGNNFDPPPTRGFAYMPDTAGGTTFMYNLNIGTHRVTNLRLSGENIAKIFTGVLTKWNDPAIARDNPGLNLPNIKIVPVVRSDGSGSTAQFTQWMIATEGSFWTTYCGKVHRSPCTQTSAYPVVPGSGMVAQSGDLGVSGYVKQKQAVGAIGYVEYSYAIQAGFPVAKVLNKAGYYTEPTAGHVAVSLLQAQINMDKTNPNTYLTQNLSKVYTNPDPRTYELSSYSYMILPTATDRNFTTAKGFTLGDFGKYLLCDGQAQVDALGYSALPINLVEAGFAQLQKIPGAQVPTATTAIIQSCHNPTFSTNGTNTLAVNDPKPPACDHQGTTQCATGTGGAPTTTPINPGAQGIGGGNGTAGAGGGAAGSPGAPGSTSNGTSAPGVNSNGVAAGSSPTADAGCDPDSGACDAAGTNAVDAADQQRQVDGVPVAASTALGGGLRTALMVLAAFLLLGVCLVPPLIAQAVSGRRAQRNQNNPFGSGQWGGPK
jgi:phosphate ABC transporter phosphate-binding protein